METNSQSSGDFTPLTPPNLTQHYSQATPNEIERYIRQKIKKIISEEGKHAIESEQNMVSTRRSSNKLILTCKDSRHQPNCQQFNGFPASFDADSNY